MYFKKVFKYLSLLIAVTVVTFALLESSPIDPVTAYVGTDGSVSIEQRALIAETWGLDKPPIERFGIWMKNMVKGDWGTSIIYRRPVLDVIFEKFLASFTLMFVSWLLSGIVGFVLGVLAGVNEGKWMDRCIKVYCHVLIATPSFWLGIIFVMFFSVQLGWFPIGLSVPIGTLADEVTLLDRITHLILPALTLSLIGIATICMHTRQKVIEVLTSDYILFAKARGESNRSIVYNHVIRNVALPAITLQFLSISELFGGAIFVEQVFSYPGLGKATVDAGLRNDFALLMGIVLITLTFVFVGNLIADFLYQLIDPRMREADQ
jgi:peptide/nickel transport system permease protein